VIDQNALHLPKPR